MTNNELLVLNELSEAGGNLRPSISVEHALTEIRDTYQTLSLAQIPFTEIAALGGSFAGIVETISDAEKKQLEKTLAFFIQYTDSGLVPIAEHIATINHLSNKPVVMLYDKNVICFHAQERAG